MVVIRFFALALLLPLNTAAQVPRPVETSSHDEGGWTVATHKQLVEALLAEHRRFVAAEFEARDKFQAAAFAAAKEAVDKAEKNSEEWRDEANEWRDTMDDREKEFAPRSEVDARISSILRDIQELKEAQATRLGQTAGTAGAQDLMTWVNGIILFGITVVGVIVMVTRSIHKTTPK
jgi:phosphopantetheinyl transferase (holo-ACP synthase)